MEDVNLKIKSSAYSIFNMLKYSHKIKNRGIGYGWKEDVFCLVICEDVNKLENQLSESLEKLISPGIFSKIKRKCRKPLMFIEELMAIRSINKKKR